MPSLPVSLRFEGITGEMRYQGVSPRIPLSYSDYFSASGFSFKSASFLAFGSVVFRPKGVSGAVAPLARKCFRVEVAVRAVELRTVPLASVSFHEFRTTFVTRTIFGQRDDLWFRQRKSPRLLLHCSRLSKDTGVEGNAPKAYYDLSTASIFAT